MASASNRACDGNCFFISKEICIPLHGIPNALLKYHFWLLELSLLFPLPVDMFRNNRLPKIWFALTTCQGSILRRWSQFVPPNRNVRIPMLSFKDV